VRWYRVADDPMGLAPPSRSTDFRSTGRGVANGSGGDDAKGDHRWDSATQN